MNINGNHSSFNSTNSIGFELSNDSRDVLKSKAKSNAESKNVYEFANVKDIADSLNDNFKITNSSLNAVVSTNGFSNYITIVDRETGDVITKLPLSSILQSKTSVKLLSEIV